ncbi:D-3-phosphoglycerate dehydrogenase/(S)-sulfolactate dehydrogenase [Virgibacillus natechei]|uniref:D-3-phosphoglycerate dehydrogenase/(S)-sulfolactate dehydrogenase n=1 Tax=Virgibacillus natechei TaxID=1216297 RepID=A0ABS4IJU3_9BACI|nr:hydroxyacid dehydrogenase [Virgibacillus natechei]MBP1971242.1 D-3-phosphoglycerate dehydrogenase/(S)-sulfolactate dehydrogenase [Virgibacillus natechei]UZD12127.1 hydroxyacid dehydrogenase [Virgibacillus natechei]
MKILVTELMWEDGIDELKRKGYTVDYDMELSRKREELLSLLPEYDALIVRNETKVDTEFLEAAKKTQVIGRLGVGLDNIDLQGARERNIPVISARNANATSVAEYVMAAMLDASRPLSDADEDVRQGNWDRKFFTGYELNKRTLGLVGMGEISHRVAKRAKAFGMNVVGFDPFVAPFDHVVQETGIRQFEKLEDLLKASDFISVHVPLTKSTKHLINRDNFPLMKPHAYVINSARGGIIHEPDLVEAVKSKQLAGAYLDVLEKEPVEKDSPLAQVKSIRLSPHIAGLTIEAQSRTAMLIAEEVDSVLNGSQSLCRVN